MVGAWRDPMEYDGIGETEKLSEMSRSGVPLLASIVLCSAAFFPQEALAEPARLYLVKRQKLEQAIQQLALQSGRQVVFAPSAATKQISPGVSGRMPFSEALQRLLAGTGLVYRISPSKIVLIEAAIARPRHDATSVTPEASAASLPPLIVTALIQTDPVSFSGDLQRSPRPNSLENLVQNVAGMGSQPSGPGQQGIIVRGVGMAGDASTIVYFGGMPISGPSGPGNDGARTASDLALIDIDYVRSSRTSRSTEHGVGALAGEIEIEPQRPRLRRWEAVSTMSASLQQGGEPGYLVAATLNAPLGDVAALRLTSYARRTGGYIDNVQTGQSNVNDDDIMGVRFMARYHPSDMLDTDLLLQWQHRRISDASAWFRPLGAYKTDRYFNAPTSHDFKLARLKNQYAPGAIKFESITAFYSWRLDRNYDRTNVTLLQSSDPAACQRYYALSDRGCSEGEGSDFAQYVSAFTPSLLHIPILSQRTMQEMRLVQESADGLNWTLGALFDHRSEQTRSELSAALSSTIDGKQYFGIRELHVHRTQKSIFADISWKSPAGFLAAAGLRYDHFTVSSRNEVVVPNIISGSIASWPTTSERSDGLHVRIHVDAPVTNALTLHTQLNRSFRPAGVNTASVLIPDRYTYGGDSLWGYEFGLKLRLLDAAQLTLTSYFNDWQGMQYRALSENRSHAYLVNIGNASIAGVEAELSYSPIMGLTAKLEGSFIKTRLTRVTPASELVGGAAIGDEIPFVPRERIRASLVREWRLGDVGIVRIGGNWQHQSGFWSTFSKDDPDFLATRGFHVFNANAQYDRGRSSLSLGIKNIFDKVANLRALTTGYGVGQSFSIGPRELSLSWMRRW